MARKLLLAAWICSAAACGLKLEGSLTALATADAGGADRDATTSGDAAADPCPSATWTLRVTKESPRALAVDRSGRLFVGGNDGPQVWIAELDRCDGRILKELRFAPDPRNASVDAMRATDGGLLVSGSVGNGVLGETESGLFARIDLALAKSDGLVLPGSGWSDLSRLSEADDGRVWLAGAEQIFGGPAKQVGWMVILGDGGCSTNLGQAIAGLTTLPNGRAILALQTDAGGTALAQLSGCSVDRMTAVPLPAQGGPNDLSLVGTDLYLVGAMGGTSFLDRGYVGSGSLDGGSFRFAAPIDPTAGFDTINRVETDELALFAAGQPNASFSGTTPTIYRYTLPIEAGAAPAWVSVPFGSDKLLLGDLKASRGGGEQDALYIVASAAGVPGGGIARCRKSTGCGP